MENNTGEEVVRAHGERHETRAQTHDNTSLFVGAVHLDLSGKCDEQRTGDRCAEGADERDRIVAGESRPVDAAREHGAEHDERGRGDLKKPGRAPHHNGLPDKSHPSELKQQCEGHRSRQHAHGIAIQNRGGAGEGTKPHELEHLCAPKTAQTAAAQQTYDRCEDEEQAAELVRKELQAVKRNPAPLPEMDAMPVQEPCEYLETMDMVQAKLCFLFTVADFDPVTELSAMRVAMAVLGGSPTSRLFVNVREKQSLCYYCSASFNSYGGMMCIDSGIEPENAKTAQQAILNEWNWLKENLPTEQEMEDARRFILNSLAAVGDSISAQENWYIGQLWRNSTESPQEVHQQLLEVTPQQVQEMMKKFHFSVAYLLTKEELTDENNH